MAVGLTCGVAVCAHALTGMIYQPQQRDISLSEEFWPMTFRELKKRGFDTLIVQWTQFGALFQEGEEKKWLERRLQDAVAADLKLVIGLYADPNTFSELEMPSDLLEPYFLENTEKNIALAKNWLSFLPQHSIVGWYLPAEIDDRRWLAESDQIILAKQLSRDVDALKALNNQPVYITSFFKGNSDPAEYKSMLSTIKRLTRLQIWVQDGVGTRALLPGETALYLRNLAACDESPLTGLVYEIFRQVGPDNQFKAEPLPPTQLATALLQRAPCRGDSIFFSLRYLINFRH
jgi:hypothetical protein